MEEDAEVEAFPVCRDVEAVTVTSSVIADDALVTRVVHGILALVYDSVPIDIDKLDITRNLTQTAVHLRLVGRIGNFLFRLEQGGFIAPDFTNLLSYIIGAGQ